MKKFFKVILCIILGLISIVIVFFLSVFLTNKLLLKKEASTITPYGQKVNIGNHKINVMIDGDEHEKTIVLLPGFATASPVIDFSSLTKLLSKKYKVVTVEPFGYGLSDAVSQKRTLKNISTELHSTLQSLNIKDYVLMGHSIAGIYSLDYMNRYKDEVTTFIGIDSSTPNQSGTDDDMSESLKILRTSGLYRFLAFINPETLLYPPVSSAQKKEFKKISLKNIGNESILDEARFLPTNFEESKLLSYPKEDSILFILSSESINDKTNGDWYELHEGMISEVKRGEIEVLEGSHYLHHTQSKKIAELTTNFLSKK